MKNNALKYYIVAFYLCSTIMMFAQPGADNGSGTLDGDGDTTPAAAPIDNYVWILAMLGLIFVFIKFRSIQNTKVNN